MDVKKLSKEQKRALLKMRQGNNMVISGPAGTGKTFLIPYLSAVYPGNVAVTATMGMVAQAIGGSTISSLLRLGLYDFPDEEIRYRNQSRSFDSDISHIRTLIIDEYYMLNRKQLHQIDVALRTTHKRNMEFGGVQIIFMGDHMQIDPYEGKPLYREYLQSRGFSFIELTKVFRQDEQGEFYRMLQRYRYNHVDPVLIERTRSMMKKPNGKQPEGVVLSPFYKEALAINKQCLAEARQKADRVMTYKPRFIGRVDLSTKPPYEELEYFPRMQVLHVINKDGLVNGDIGTVINIHDADGEQAVLVNFVNKGEIWVHPYKTQNTKITFTGEGKTKERHEEILGSSEYIPLVPCYALSVRKAQGMTLQSGCLSEQIFAPDVDPKKRYTGLSRFTDLRNVYLV